jgi:hypothetical protein
MFRYLLWNKLSVEKMSLNAKPIYDAWSKPDAGAAQQSDGWGDAPAPRHNWGNVHAESRWHSWRRRYIRMNRYARQALPAANLYHSIHSWGVIPAWFSPVGKMPSSLAATVPDQSLAGRSWDKSGQQLPGFLSSEFVTFLTRPSIVHSSPLSKRRVNAS